MAKLHDLLARLAIDRIGVILGVVVVHNEEGMFQLRGGIDTMVLLDFGAQLVILGKITIDAFRLIMPILTRAHITF
jgi:hypothetical protein